MFDLLLLLLCHSSSSSSSKLKTDNQSSSSSSTPDSSQKQIRGDSSSTSTTTGGGTCGFHRSTDIDSADLRFLICFTSVYDTTRIIYTFIFQLLFKSWLTTSIPICFCIAFVLTTRTIHNTLISIGTG